MLQATINTPASDGSYKHHWLITRPEDGIQCAETCCSVISNVLYMFNIVCFFGVIMKNKFGPYRVSLIGESYWATCSTNAAPGGE